MCTIVAIKDVDSLIVAANRDEYYARAATPPRIVRESPRAIAGLDLAKGGTWMGANERGIFVAITNQRTHRRAESHRLSRGEVVMEALGCESVAAIDAMMRELDPRDYNAFNVIYGDARELRVGYARHDRDRIEIEALADGIWVLPNDRIGSPDFPKTERAHALVLRQRSSPRLELAQDERSLKTLLADHDKPELDRIAEPPSGSMFGRELLRELQAICIHTPVYGTRSATILQLAPGRVARYLFADGPPCTAPFRDVTDLFSSPA